MWWGDDARGVDIERLTSANVVVMIIVVGMELLRSTAHVAGIFDARVNDGYDPRGLVGRDGYVGAGSPQQAKSPSVPPLVRAHPTPV